MKYLFASDIHGSIEKLERVLEAFKREEADKLVLLGDTSSSDSNSDNWLIAETLNKIKNKVELIRGNCDRYEFEELLEFEIYDIDNLYINGKFVTITHGHYYNMYELPSNCGDIFIQGHTHIPALERRGDKILANPGSVTRPRGVDLRCYILINEEKISIKTLEGKIVKTLDLS